MKIIIFGYNRFTTMTTSQWLGDLPHTVLCHTQEQYDQFLTGGRLGAGAELIDTRQPKGLPYNRNWALNNLLQEGEWALFLVDDFKKATYLDSNEFFSSDNLPITNENQSVYRKQFNATLSPDKFMQLIGRDIVVADIDKYNLIGFSLTENPMFRTRKYSNGGLADGRAWLVRKTGLRFDVNACLMDDYAWCALNKKHFGGYLINNWIYFEMERYTPGGCGTKEERMGDKIKECQYLTTTYPEYIAYAEKAGWPPNSHIRIRSTKVNPSQQQLF